MLLEIRVTVALNLIRLETPEITEAIQKPRASLLVPEPVSVRVLQRDKTSRIHTHTLFRERERGGKRGRKRETETGREEGREREGPHFVKTTEGTITA